MQTLPGESRAGPIAIGCMRLSTAADRRSVGGGWSASPIEGEIVLIMGLPGAGKSTVAREFVARGYARLNRDEAGGSLRGLLPELEHRIRSGTTRLVLDNSYASRASRTLVVQAAGELGVPVRCVGSRQASKPRRSTRRGAWWRNTAACSSLPTHGGGPPVCWCRKPLPGLGVIFVQRYRLNPAQCLYVGSGPQDPGFARRLGFQYRDAKDFF